LNNPKDRSNLAKFYIKPSQASPLKPSIILNGRTVEDASELQKIFENEVAKVHYEIEGFDAQVLNPNYTLGAPDSGLDPAQNGKKMSILVTVFGTVKFWKDSVGGVEASEANEVDGKSFSDTFVLVPNWEAFRPNSAKGLNKFLIRNQNFRETAD
jgi:NTF2-related export protein 1/2